MCAADVGDEVRPQYVGHEPCADGEAPRAQCGADGLLSDVAARGDDLHQ